MFYCQQIIKFPWNTKCPWLLFRIITTSSTLSSSSFELSSSSSSSSSCYYNLNICCLRVYSNKDWPDQTDLLKTKKCLFINHKFMSTTRMAQTIAITKRSADQRNPTMADGSYPWIIIIGHYGWKCWFGWWLVAGWLTVRTMCSLTHRF